MTTRTIGGRTVTKTPRAKRTLLERAGVFLRVMGNAPDVRPNMERMGYSAKTHALGWRLFMERRPDVTADDVQENPARAAFDELKEIRPSVLTRVRAALHHESPDHERFVFAEDGIDLMSADALPAMVTFLDRIQALRDSPDRKATRKADHAALRALEERGLDEAFFTRLAELVASAGTDANAAELASPNPGGRGETRRQSKPPSTRSRDGSRNGRPSRG